MGLKKNYVSEIDGFLTELLNKNPQLKDKQKKLRSTWWDRQFIDPNEQKEYQQNSITVSQYPYFDYSKNNK
jgi:hypothetical protein